MNKTGEYIFTIIVPVFNEEDGIAALEKAFASYLPKCPVKACVLFVNDGSRDDSLSRLKDICSRNEDFYYLSFAANAGLTSAIKAGFDSADSPLVGYIDADLQTSPEDFNLLLDEIDRYSMVTGVRTGRKDTAFKRFQSRFGNGWRRMFTHDGATDTGCPLKVFHTDVARKFPMFKGMHRFFPALVLLQDGGSYKEVPVRHFPRVAGASKFTIWNRMISGMNDCFAYRWMKKRTRNFRIAEDNL